MSTDGSRVRRFLEVAAYVKRTSEDYNPLGPPTYVLEINGVSLSISFRRGRRTFYVARDLFMLGTSRVFVEVDVFDPFIARVESSGDYPEHDRHRS